MAKKKVEIFVLVDTEQELEHLLEKNKNILICAEIYDMRFGFCTALDRSYSKIKIFLADGNILMLRISCNHIQAFERCVGRSEPFVIFIDNKRVTNSFRGVSAMNLEELAKKEIYYHNMSKQGVIFDRQTYALNELTPLEIEWQESVELEVSKETQALARLRVLRQAARKRHRAELMAPFLARYNFVLFWPHARHAHPELYERWDENNIVMVGREDLELTKEMAEDIMYSGDVVLNEAALGALLAGPALAICFRALDDDIDFVALVRRILYQDVPEFDETKSLKDQPPRKTAFDLYKTFSLTREEIWKQRRMEKEHRKAEKIEKRQRRLSEMRRLAMQAREDAIEEKRKQKEEKKLQLLKSGNLEALDKLKAEPEEEDVDIVIPEELSDEESVESILVEDEDEYFAPAGLLIPAFYAPPNEIAKANGLALLFPKLVKENVDPQEEFLPPHVLVMLHISKRHKAINIMVDRRQAILNMGIFKATTPYNAVHIAYSVKQYDKMRLDIDESDVKLIMMISTEVDIPLLCLMDLVLEHVSRDEVKGEDECAHVFPVDYGDDYNQFEDFEQ